MKTNTIVRFVAGLGLVLLLGSCLIDGGDTEDTGSLRVGLPTVGSSAISAGVDTVRLWLYTPSNLEFGIDGGAARLPSAANNFLEADITSSGGFIVIDGVPAASGYRLVIVLGTDDSGVFVPLDVAESSAFEVTGGRETALSLTAEAVTGLTPALEGTALNGVVVEDVVTASVFATSSTKLYCDVFGTPTQYAVGTDLAGASKIYSLSSANFDSSDYVLVNTDYGVFPAYDNSGFSIDTAFADTMDAAGISDVVDSGGFFIVDTDEYIVYYQRLGGLGGGVFPDLVSAAAADWNDSGTDLADYIDADQSPVRGAATDGTSQAFISSVLGTFAVNDTYFEGEFDAGQIIAGDDSAGLTFWGVAYPGSTQPLRITQLGWTGGKVIVGTPRGAFVFAATAIAQASDNNGLIPSSAVTQVDAVRNRPILDMSVNDGYIAIATARQVTVLDATTFVAEFTKPLRAVALGAPADVFVVDNSGSPEVYIAGSDGLTKVVE